MRDALALTAFTIGTLLALGLVSMGCMHRVDPAQVIAALPEDAGRARLAELYQSRACQEQFVKDDAQCWSVERDGDVVIETGISRSLHGYLLSPFTVQTHLKVKVQHNQADVAEVYYFADGGEGGLDAKDGYGVADGHVNVLCTTQVDQLFDPEVDSNHLVQQQEVDDQLACVYRALSRGGHFAPQVKHCIQPLRSRWAQAQQTFARADTSPLAQR